MLVAKVGMPPGDDHDVMPAGVSMGHTRQRPT